MSMDQPQIKKSMMPSAIDAPPGKSTSGKLPPTSLARAVAFTRTVICDPAQGCRSQAMGQRGCRL